LRDDEGDEMAIERANELLSVSAAAARLGVSRSAMYVLINRGEIEYVPVFGTRKRVLARSIDAYIERRRQG
jgi:excisionase family DNA binding protein